MDAWFRIAVVPAAQSLLAKRPSLMPLRLNSPSRARILPPHEKANAYQRLLEGHLIVDGLRLRAVERCLAVLNRHGSPRAATIVVKHMDGRLA
jgi:hypothetical protein